MSWLDISTYISLSLDDYILGTIFLVVLFGLIGLFLFITIMETNVSRETGEKVFKRYAILSMCFGVIAPLFVFFPTHNKILEVKISRIKNEAVSKENVTKGVETLERISKKLECKYLGCEND